MESRKATESMELTKSENAESKNTEVEARVTKSIESRVGSENTESGMAGHN